MNVALRLLIGLAAAACGAGGGATPEADDASVVPDEGVGAGRAPIAIRSDADFTAANGVVSGLGTDAQPFVIAGWEIDAAAPYGIVIEGTTAPVVVRDVRVEGATEAGVLIADSAAHTVAIERVTLVDNAVGLHVSGADGVRIVAAEVADNGVGVAVAGARDVLLLRVAVDGNQTGIALTDVTKGLVYGGRVYDQAGDGIVVRGGVGTEIAESVVANNAGSGVVLGGSWSSVGNCQVDGNGTGITLDGEHHRVFLTTLSGHRAAGSGAAIAVTPAGRGNVIVANDLRDNDQHVADAGVETRLHLVDPWFDQDVCESSGTTVAGVVWSNYFEAPTPACGETTATETRADCAGDTHVWYPDPSCAFRLAAPPSRAGPEWE